MYHALVKVLLLAAVLLSAAALAKVLELLPVPSPSPTEQLPQLDPPAPK